jgi:hypothetical protein
VKPKTKLARDLSPGDYLVTALGVAPVSQVEPDHGGLAVHLDIRHPRSTRPGSETSVLWLYPDQTVRFRPGTVAQPLNQKRRVARDKGWPGKIAHKVTKQEESADV